MELSRNVAAGEMPPNYDESARELEMDKVDRDSLSYILYEALLEKRRRLGL